MISVNRRTLYGEVYNDVRCLSSDEKPTEGVKNGSTLIEIDTGKRYLYDALSGSWNEFSQGGGGEYVLPTMSQSVKGGATLGEGLSISGDSLSVDYSEVASVESLESATKLEADGGIKRTSNGLSVDYSEVASVDALEEATALSPTGGIVSTQDGLAISPEQSSTGAIDGALLELTAKSKPATQATTDDPPSPSPDYPQPIVTVTGHEVTGKEGRYVSLERRDSQGTLLSTTPIPLPSRGWVAGLPDGTADTLTLDGAGKVTWERKTDEVVLDGNDTSNYIRNDELFRIVYKGVQPLIAKPADNNTELSALATHLIRRTYNRTYNNADGSYQAGIGAFGVAANGLIAICKPLATMEAYLSWLQSNPVTILYPLATPVTETCGYVNLPDMQDCVLSIPELDALGVRYTIGDGAEIARQWHERNESEVAAATTEALGNVAPLEGDTASANYAVGDYLVHDGTLCKVTSAIATGETVALGTNVTATTVMAEILALQTGE